MEGMLARSLRAMARRAAEGELDALGVLAEIESELPGIMRQAAAGAHAFGYSWAAIGDELGVSRQSAHERFGGQR